MKKSLLLIFLAAIVLAGCASNKSTFEQKQECASHKDEMLQDAIMIHQEWMNITGDPYDLNIEEIFYSKKYASCLYILGIYKWVDVDAGQKFLLNKYVYDFFSKKEILSTEDLDSNKQQTKMNQFENNVNAIR